MNPFPRWLTILLGYLLALLIAVTALVQLNNAQNQSEKIDSAHTLTITATGKVEAVPDLAIVDGSVVIEGSSAADVKQKSVQKGNDVADALRSLGIDSKDIKTNYYLSPKYSYLQSGQNINGYTANESFEVKVHNVNNAGQVVDTMTAKGVNQVGNINYTFEDPDKYKEMAREQALQNAKDRAQQLASIAGVQLGKVLTFQETSSSFPRPLPYAMGMGMGGAAPQSDVAAPPSAQFSPGTNEVTADVSVTYQLQ